MYAVSIIWGFFDRINKEEGKSFIPPPTHCLCYAFKRFGPSLSLLSKSSSEQLTQLLRAKHCSCISFCVIGAWDMQPSAHAGWVTPFVEVSLICTCYVQSLQRPALLMQWCGQSGNCFLQEMGAVSLLEVALCFVVWGSALFQVVLGLFY